jgi:hypothetical protein
MKPIFLPQRFPGSCKPDFLISNTSNLSLQPNDNIENHSKHCMFLSFYIRRGRTTSFSMVTYWTNGVRYSAGEEIFLLRNSIQIGSGAYLTSNGGAKQPHHEGNPPAQTSDKVMNMGSWASLPNKSSRHGAMLNTGTTFRVCFMHECLSLNFDDNWPSSLTKR